MRSGGMRILVLLLLSSLVLAEEGAPDSLLDSLVGGDLHVTAKYKEMPASRLLKNLGRIAGFRVTFEVEEDEPISIDADSSIAKLLELLAEAGGFVYDVPEPDHLVVRSAKEEKETGGADR